MLNNYATLIFTFIAGMVFGVMALAWIIMKIYNTKKGKQSNGPDNG